MNIVTLLGAGLLAAGTIAAVPADAQRHGHDGYRHGYAGGGHGSYGRGYRVRGGNGRHYGYVGHGYRGGYAGGYRGGRVVCRVHRSYHGPVRTCFRR